MSESVHLGLANVIDSEIRAPCFLEQPETHLRYCPQQAKHFVLEDDKDTLRETLLDVCDDDEYISVMAKLGYRATVDL